MERVRVKDVDALATIITALKALSSDEQERTLHAAAAFLRVKLAPETHRREWSGSADLLSSSANRPPAAVYSENRTISPKDFVRDKSPQTDVERVVVLAYYLTNYRDLLSFRALDISALNTEAAQPKFANVSVLIDEAARAGYFTSGTKNGRQISQIGESLVQKLPERDVVSSTGKSIGARKKTKKISTRKIPRKKSLI
ncbi:Uncharacterised protein [Acinetobacter baumannii]|nr:Uncharacterised protein [Acinetobacter baumannii]